MSDAGAAAVEGQVAEGQVDQGTEGAGEAGDASSESAVWYDSAPDEIKGYIQNKGWDDPIKAVQSYKELEKYQGASPDQIIKLPKDGESMDGVYDKLGRPESADKYELELPQDMTVDDGFLGAIKEAAHSSGLNSSQLNGVAKAYLDYSTKVQTEQQQALEQQQTLELENLKKEWGEGFEERAELGRRFIRSNLPEGLDKTQTLSAIEEAIGTAAMLKLFANSGMGKKEDVLPSSEGDRPFGYTAEQAKADKRELMQTIQADPERLANYNKGVGPDLDKMKRLNKIIAGA